MPRKSSKLETDLLVEIGTEELPAAYLDGAIAQLQDDAQRLLNEAHLAHGAVESFGTPRRLVLIVRALSAVQRNPAEQIRGPSKQAAFSPDGKPTQALLGFLRSRGGTVAQTAIVPTEKGEYVYLSKPEREAPTAAVLSALLQSLIGRLRFPKTMRWDHSGARFARPIRWLLVLLDGKPLRVTLGRVVSQSVTIVGGPKRPKPVAVKSVAAYHAALRRDGVILDPRLRRHAIERLVASASAQQKGIVTPEAVSYGLLDEVTHLVERPASFVGQFDQKYLVLPREVLLASMAKHQRIFAVQTRAGQLLPTFIAITDGKPKKPEAVRRTYEHILNARLADAMLFWEQDRRRPLGQADLSGVTFHEKLGSMHDKIRRMRQLVNPLAQAWQLSAGERAHLERATELAKSDLPSTLVKEFPTLQGVMGKYYALDAKEPAQVAEAIEEQYLPIGGRLPKTLIGAALAVVEKYDTLSAYFAIGIEPTGDQDPFGLRRAAQGVVEVAWSLHRALPLSALFRAVWETAPFRSLEKDALRSVKERVQRYLLERLYSFAWPAPTPGRDLIDAVLSSPCDDVVDAMDRVRSLRRLDGHRSLLKAAKVIERTRNILRSAPKTAGNGVNEALFTEDLERRVWAEYGKHRPIIEALIKNKDYANATTTYGEALYDVVHEFFDRVMVNVKEADIQQNRLALMRSINALYTDRVADLSKLTILEEGKV